MKYLERKEPIDAICWDGTNKDEIWQYWKYIQFAENLDGTVDGLVPVGNGQTVTLSIGDFLTFGPRGEAVPVKRADFLFRYEEYTPEIPRVSVNCDISELNKKIPYVVEIEVPENLDLETQARYLNSAKENFDNAGISSVIFPKYLKVNTTELTKKGIYLTEIDEKYYSISNIPAIKKTLEDLGIKTVLSKADSIKLKELDIE